MIIHPDLFFMRDFLLILSFFSSSIFAAANQGVTVEAIGYATLEENKTLSEAHRKALQDASSNAVVQAKVTVNVNVKVNGMELSEKGVRTHGTGFIDQMTVEEAGLIPDMEPPVYRVRVSALVKPMSTVPASFTDSFDVDQDAWKPVIALTVKSEVSTERREIYTAAIRRALESCGVKVLDDPQKNPSLLASVVIGHSERDEETWTTVNWKMTLGTTENSMDAANNRSIHGSWTLDEQNPSSEWWKRLGVMMAQDSMRLWNTPRLVKLTLENLSAEQSSLLAAAIDQQGHISNGITFEQSPIHTVILPIVGNSLNAVDVFLRQANLLEELELIDATMVEVHYRHINKTHSSQPQRMKQVGEQWINQGILVVE
ncbi:MAG: hypothetical protein JJT75_13915 [Opitutales bacterium]|nr:hypothetical protein [Opitutales bacterium]MCH8541167.1 hypothetical protein [Opitutales bacterium]